MINLLKWVFECKMGKSPYENMVTYQEQIAIRAEDLNEMFRDNEVDGIICMRGGYGTPRILDLIDYEAIKIILRYL